MPGRPWLVWSAAGAVPVLWAQAGNCGGRPIKTGAFGLPVPPDHRPRKAKAAARRGCRWSGRSTLLDPMKEEEGGRGCRAGAAARLRGRGAPASAAKRPPAPGRAGGRFSPRRRPGSPQAPRQRLRPGRRASTSRRRSARCSRSRGRSSSPPACAGAAHAGPACS